MTTKNIFWVVLADANQTTITKRHADENPQRDEAERLVRKPGRAVLSGSAVLL